MAMSGGGPDGIQSDINVTPMADVMLVLLIIFMITAPLVQQGVQINKPKAVNANEAPELDADGVTTVTVTRDQVVYVNDRPVPDDELLQTIIDARENAPELPLFVRGDVAAPFGRIVEIINLARDADYEKIGMVVDREKQD